MSFIETLFSAFETLWNLITNVVTGLTTFLSVVFHSLTLPPQLTLYLPSFLSASVMAVVSIAVIKLIIGWGNS